MAPLRLGILGSGRGSNFLAISKHIQEADLNAEIAIVLSDKPSVMLEKAHELGLKNEFVDPKRFASRERFDEALVSRLLAAKVDLVVLAGYMRIVSDIFINAFPRHILNIHPSLLPLFKGLHPQQQALDAGVKESGCSVHWVTSELDSGPIVLQKSVPVLPDDTEQSLSARILVEEHTLYSQAISLIAKEMESR